MIRKLAREESGYSLVEVMVSILILAIAIIPMVGMFDMGLKSATRGGNYDKARTLANLKLEQAKSMYFVKVKEDFPETPTPPTPATTYNVLGHYQSGWKTESGADFTNVEYQVEKQFMQEPPTAPTLASANFEKCDPISTDPTKACSPGTHMIRLTVTVRWPGGNSYTAYGLVAG